MFASLPLTALRAFESASRLLSFKAAAEELSVTPTAVSHQIRSLESWIGVIQRLQLATRAEAETAATGDDQGFLALQQRRVLGNAVVQGVIEGQAQPHDLIDPGLEAAGHTEVVHRRGNQQQIMIEQLANQLVAERQIGLHRQWPRLGFRVKRCRHERLVYSWNQCPANFTTGDVSLRMAHLPGAQKTFRQTARS